MPDSKKLRLVISQVIIFFITVFKLTANVNVLPFRSKVYLALNWNIFAFKEHFIFKAFCTEVVDISTSMMLSLLQPKCDFEPRACITIMRCIQPSSRRRFRVRLIYDAILRNGFIFRISLCFYSPRTYLV